MKKLLCTAVSAIGLAAPAIAADKKPAPMAVPGMFGPLTAYPDPLKLTGPLGDIYVTGAVSALGLWQDNPVPGNDDRTLDLDNAHLIIQKADGPFQFYAQFGGYSFPALGAAYLDMPDTTDAFFGAVPVAYVKFAPNDKFSIQAGKLYTLIGTENTFTFQNANIQRGLLWNQTNAVNRGVQVNFADGPINASLALSDGFYSGTLDWLSGLLTYTIDSNNSVTVIASGNLGSNPENTLATPLAQNNSEIYNLSFTHVSGAWTFTPTLQYTHVPEDAGIGLAASAESVGVGLTTKYAFNDNWSVAGRAEYIDTSGGTNLAYGPGSGAWSLTLTPTYQQGVFFARAELSYVEALDITPGSGFGGAGTDTSQARFLIETGVIF